MSTQQIRTRQVQVSFLTFIQAYKNLFTTTYSSLQTQPTLPAQSPQSMQLKQQLITQLYQSYRSVLQSIDSLQQVDMEQNKKQIDQQESQKNSMMYMGNQVTGNREQQKYQHYEKDICDAHDSAVKRYKEAVKNVQIWKEHLYKYINQNMPSGGNH